MQSESERKENSSQDIPDREPHRVRLPRFVSDDDIGLGDAISRMSHAVGFRRCGGCARRASALNRWIVFTR
jgi:hypothetical protein